LRDKQHELLGFGVIMRDATERHNHLELLRQSEERLRLMIETVQDYAIFMLDPLGNAASWNSGAQNIKGYSSNEIIGRHFSLFYTPEDVATGKPREEFATANACGRVEDEGWRVRRDRSRFWANVMITAVHDEVGTLRGFAKITRDMTERTQLIELERSRELAMQFQSTREDEQRRIARELHDDLGQQLTALKMGTALLEGNLIASDGARHLASQTHDLQKEIDSMMASIRRIASDLRPPVLDDLGLLAAIDWLADDLRHRYGVVVSARLETGDLMFNDAAATAIFRIVQEALTNVARHAQASAVTLEMTCSDSTCALRIEDNGQGVLLHAPRSEKSFGLLGMHERARQLNGTVAIDTAPGSGFRILVRLPIYAIVADATCQARSDSGLD
jgi:PAS domain S-box-containing protein